MALCLAAGAVATKLGLAAFTLIWTHSVERVRWEEDWQVTSPTLTLIEARIKGSGAGMEPPDGAILEDGYWRYRPDLDPIERLKLARSGAVDDWRLCTPARGCAELAELLPGLPAAAAVTLTACG